MTKDDDLLEWHSLPLWSKILMIAYAIVFKSFIIIIHFNNINHLWAKWGRSLAELATSFTVYR